MPAEPVPRRHAVLAVPPAIQVRARTALRPFRSVHDGQDPEAEVVARAGTASSPPRPPGGAERQTAPAVAAVCPAPGRENV